MLSNRGLCSFIGTLAPFLSSSVLYCKLPSKLGVDESRNKKDRESIGSSWRRRLKGMLFFDWNFPISNNKLKLLFPEGDLNTALNAKYVLPKPAAVIYSGTRGRNIQKEFREWLIKCHEVCHSFHWHGSWTRKFRFCSSSCSCQEWGDGHDDDDDDDDALAVRVPVGGKKRTIPRKLYHS